MSVLLTRAVAARIPAHKAHARGNFFASAVFPFLFVFFFRVFFSFFCAFSYYFLNLLAHVFFKCFELKVLNIDLKFFKSALKFSNLE